MSSDKATSAMEESLRDDEATLEDIKASPEELALLEEMIKAGVLHGRKHSFTNPKMNKYVIATRKGIDVIDLEATNEMLERAGNYLKILVDSKRPILVVGTRAETRDLVEKFADSFAFPKVTGRWLGGTLTNYPTIWKRIEYMKKLRADKLSGALEKYTKKERLMLTNELARLNNLFSGIETMSVKPAAMIVIDANLHKHAVHEANLLEIPVIALINTDTNPDKITYPIPRNFTGRSSLEFILTKLSSKLRSA